MKEELREKIKARHEKAKAESGDFETTDFWNAKEGENHIRFLPHWEKPGEEFFWVEARVHFKVGPNSDAILCVKETYGEECLVCNRMI
jgi:hypothetical protein